jgi:hypothetical protein
MKAAVPRQSELAVIAPLVPLLVAPLISVRLEARLPSPSLRALTVGLAVLGAALVVVAVQLALRVRPTRKLGPIGMAVVLSAIATIGVFATSFMD